MKALLIAMTVMAVVRPEHVLPFLLVSAVIAGVVALIALSVGAFKAPGSSVLTLARPDDDGQSPAH
jgi:Flp pilus assembly protein protease CpaA